MTVGETVTVTGCRECPDKTGVVERIADGQVLVRFPAGYASWSELTQVRPWR